MDPLSMILGLLFIVAISCGGWIVWGVVQSRERARELKMAREREETERLRLRLEAEDRAQERADRIYLDTLDRHSNPQLPRRDGTSPDAS
ncbi:hypothetical protein CLV30_113107 [Haloactinopolyspora alba]|uniref:Uncharacterized protein n=1 Tax=Haloactinopolyspora alba TaxID=648780 RepID=A0A2P8DWL4_9ACTN|nr:hypothetical protein [Haloactinopolyspora alba]PSL01619.1 hypothetical protein CLV30_113107 [Haloactinopolyspora alba]